MNDGDGARIVAIQGRYATWTEDTPLFEWVPVNGMVVSSDLHWLTNKYEILEREIEGLRAALDAAKMATQDKFEADSDI